ncbi:2-dehydropantoate 2-reductase [Saccharopolyspora sp. K220]|nr:2-dehydropantoate 2-reductase [Saccharopolyspora soli]
MADAGHEVHAITLWADHVAAMRANGLRVEGASGDRTVRLQAATTTDGIGPCDLVIIACKAADVVDAARSAKALVGESTVVQTIQNGLGSADRVAEVLGAERLSVGVVGGFGASLTAPGHVHHNGMEMVRFGAYGGLSGDAVERGASVWRSAGFAVQVFDDIERMVWEKLIMNVAFSASTCLTGMTIGEVLAHPEAWHVARRCTEEAVAVAQARGISLQVGDPVEHVRELGGKIPNARPSMLLDHLAGRRSEIDVINGAIPRQAATVGLAAPVNDTVTALVKAREVGFAA